MSNTKYKLIFQKWIFCKIEIEWQLSWIEWRLFKAFLFSPIWQQRNVFAAIFWGMQICNYKLQQKIGTMSYVYQLVIIWQNFPILAGASCKVIVNKSSSEQ